MGRDCCGSLLTASSVCGCSPTPGWRLPLLPGSSSLLLPCSHGHRAPPNCQGHVSFMPCPLCVAGVGPGHTSFSLQSWAMPHSHTWQDQGQATCPSPHRAVSGVSHVLFSMCSWVEVGPPISPHGAGPQHLPHA